jgi:AraC-like DNA-binding protein
MSEPSREPGAGNRRRRSFTPFSDRLRLGPALPIPAILRELGIDPAVVLRRVGLDTTLLQDPDRTVAFDVVGRLLEESAAATGRAHFGLLVGQRFSPATLGVVYQLMKHSSSLREALRNMAMYFHLHDRGGVPYFVHGGPGEVGMAYGIYHRGEFDTGPFYDASLAIACSALRDLCGAAWRPVRVTFSHRRPADLVPYRRFFGAPLVFDAQHSAVLFDERWLDEPVKGSDPALHAAFAELVGEKQAAEALPLADKVRRVLRRMVLAGTASSERVAFLFAMSRRSLHRGLQADGTSLQMLVNEIRFEVARQLMNETDMPAGEIAAVLHYADASAFSRAFKAWSGTSPRDWRHAMRCAPARSKRRRGPARIAREAAGRR